MLTLSNQMNSRIREESVEVHYVLILDIDGSRFVFSDIDMRVDVASVETEVYGIMEPISGIIGEVFPIERRPSVGNVSIRLNNIRKIQNKRVSTLLAEFKIVTAQIYVVLGSGTSGLSDIVDDGLRVFNGAPRTGFSFTDTTVSMELESFNDWPMLPSEVGVRKPILARVPYVVGDNRFDNAVWQGKPGRIRCAQDESNDAKWYLCHQGAKLIDTVWAWLPDLGVWAEILTGQFSFNGSDNGRTSITLNDPSAVVVNLHVYPDHLRNDAFGHAELGSGSFDTDPNHFIGPHANAYDADIATYGILTNGWWSWIGAPSYYGYQKGLVQFGFPDLIDGGSEPYCTIDNNNIVVQWRCNDQVDLNGMEVIYGIAPYGTAAIFIFDGPGSHHAWSDATIFNSTDQQKAIAASLDFDGYVGLQLRTKNVKLKMSVWRFDNVNNDVYQDPDGSEMLRIHEVKLKIRATMNFLKLQKPYEVWWTGSGPAIQTDIGDRSYGGYTNPPWNDGNVWPVIAIEKILREECGLTDADIDEDQFTYTQGRNSMGNFEGGGAFQIPAHKTRIVIDKVEQIRADRLIKEICENHGLLFYYDFAGRARCADITTNNGPLGTHGAFDYNDLTGLPEMFESDRTAMAQHVDIDFDHFATHREARSYRSRYQTGGLSQEEYGTQTATAAMRFILPGAFGATTPWNNPVEVRLYYLLARPLRFVRISVKGMKAVGVEVLDWIGVTGGQFAALLKNYEGVSLHGFSGIVVKKEMRSDRIILTLMKPLPFTTGG